MARKLTREELEDLYYRRGLSLRQIARYCGYRDHTTILKWMENYGLRRRPRPEANELANKSPLPAVEEPPPEGVNVPPGVLSSAKNVAVLGDTHCPFEDRSALEVACRVLEEARPDVVVLNGDLIDCYALSPFDQDPERRKTLKKETDHLVAIGKDIRSAIPARSVIVVLSGAEDNHMQRIVRFLHRNEALHDWPGVQPWAILRVSEYGGYYAEGPIFVRGLVISHGEVTRKHSCDAAQEMLLRRMTCGVMGHTHRLGLYFLKTAWKPTLWYAESGCLCSLEPSYVRNPNWQQGLVVVTFSDDGIPHAELVHIEHGTTVFRGKLLQV